VDPNKCEIVKNSSLPDMNRSSGFWGCGESASTGLVLATHKGEVDESIGKKLIDACEGILGLIFKFTHS
jgi:hypothetical protein